MSYPARLQVLIVEDTLEVKQSYETLLEEVRTKYDILGEVYASSYEEGLRHLKRGKIFHLVFLDLKLPQKDGLPEDSVDHGVSLLAEAAARDDYPIPALIIASGHMSSANQSKLESKLDNDFFFGRARVKGYENIKIALSESLDACMRYLSIGIHVRDDGNTLRPALSPREEDLLRRFALKEPSRIGLDLAWWSFDKKASEQGRPVWTKVLIGKAMLNTGDNSRILFFKFTSTLNAQNDIAGARRLDEKLSHIKLKAFVESSTMTLIVTEKAGNAERAPESLTNFLGAAACEERHCKAIAQQIVEQTQALGERNPYDLPVHRLLWPYHSIGNLRAAVANCPNAEGNKEAVEAMFASFEELSKDGTSVRISKQTSLHGDLHAGNIALDVNEGDVEAKIFDAAGATNPNSTAFDIANLEVTVILHQGADAPVPMVDDLSVLYECAEIAPDAPAPGSSARVRNVYQMVKALRGAIRDSEDPLVYALLVHDAALIQLGCLSGQFSQNKISLASEALTLAIASHRWLVQLRAQPPAASA